MLTTAAPSPEMLTQALELIARRAKFAACTLARLHVSPTNAFPPRLIPYVTCPRHPLHRPEQSPRTFDLANAPWHHRAVESKASVVVRQDQPAQRMDAAERAILGWDAFHSVALVPLIAEGHTLGVLACCETHPWSRAQITQQRIHLLENLGNLLALALSHLQGKERVERYAGEFRWLGETIAVMEKQPEADARAQFVLEAVCLHFCPTQAALYLLQSEPGVASCWIGSAEILPRQLMGAQHVRINAEDVVGRVLETRKTVCRTTPMPEASAPLDPRASSNGRGAQTTATVPLKTDGQALGALQVTRPNAEAFDALDLGILEGLMGQLATGIAAVRAQGAIRASAVGLQTLQRLSREITTSLDIDEVCRAIYHSAREVMDCDLFYVALYDDPTKELEYIFRVDKGELLASLRAPIQDGMMDYVLRLRSAVLVSDVEQEPRFSVWHWDGPFHTHSLVCVPMQVGDRVLGAISVQSYRRDAYTGADLEILAALTSQAAVAINNAQLFAASQRQMRQLSVLNEIGRIVTSTIEIDRVLERIYEQVRRILQADSYYVALFDSEEQALVMEIIVDEGEHFPRVRVPSGQGYANIVLQRRAPLLIRDLEHEEASLPLDAFLVGKPRASQSWLGVPMLTSTHPLGVLAVASYEKNAFNPGDQEVLLNIASQAAIAVDNARHHAQVEDQARRDSLTQALNHGYFLARLQEEVPRAIQTSKPLSLIMLDLDSFKAYNDHYGHLAGDAILRGVVSAIIGSIHATDLVGRWGGEEFAVALLNTDRDSARSIAGRIRRTLAQKELQDDQGRAVPVPTVSQGIATLPDDECEPMALVDLADRRLYLAKARGRDQVEG